MLFGQSACFTWILGIQLTKNQLEKDNDYVTPNTVTLI
ncbi:hypothetical protein HMPREF1048_0629 [Streptococcus mitis SK575]|uniref:Uncharacterized protein n=1 Tax=Streptococcus mitis SK575 TaxID=1095736 RepID=I0T1S3_STRMT|nr:hypothetical protein HMPREF1048_0629 [Streptococcus mitis SK575]